MPSGALSITCAAESLALALQQCQRPTACGGGCTARGIFTIPWRGRIFCPSPPRRLGEGAEGRGTLGLRLVRTQSLE